jgi:leucyl-tRNA synthetase
LTHEVWNYIFKKGAYPAGCTIPEDNLKKLRAEFEYWYPMDLRVSAKDLIRNHLTMSLYNHYAIWESPDMMPRGFFCNGYILVNGKKMSKSEGNFFTLKDCINKFGADATRFALADAGDSLDDANFEESVANAAISRLYNFERFIADVVAGKDSEPTYDLWDSLFENEIHHLVNTVKQSYDEIKFKQVLKFGFFEMQALKDDYVLAKKDGVSKLLMLSFIEASLIILNPICPHFSEHCWREYLLPIYKKAGTVKGASSILLDQGWFKTREVDHAKRAMYEFLKSMRIVARNAQLNALSAGKKDKKPAGKKGTQQFEKCTVSVALSYPAWYLQTVEILNEAADIEDPQIIDKVKQRITANDLPRALKLAGHLKGLVKDVGRDNSLSVSIPFNEIELI